MATEESGAELPPPSFVARRQWRPPDGVRRSHIGLGVMFLIILVVLVAGLFQAIGRPGEESLLVRQLTPRPRTTPSSQGPTAVPGTGGSPIAVQSITATLPPSATPTATGTATTTPTVTGTPPPTATATLPPGARVHVVQAGDTMHALAQRYGTTVEAIMQANAIAERGAPLRVGQRLVILPR